MIEFEILAHGLYLPGQLAITYDPSLKMPTTPAIQQWMDTLWQQKLAIAQEKNIPLYDSKLFRLVHVETRHAARQGNITPVGAGEERRGEGTLGSPWGGKGKVSGLQRFPSPIGHEPLPKKPCSWEYYLSPDKVRLTIARNPIS